MLIHPQARTIISTLSLPSPIKKYFSSLEWEVDLSNNTNPHGGQFAEYPDVKHTALKDAYLNKILSLNPPPGFRKDLGLSSDNVLFTVGSMEGLDLVLRTFAEPNKDRICILHPSFSAYEHWARLHNLGVSNIPFLGKNLDSIDVEAIVIANPKIVFLCNPNNPTGTTLTAESVEKLCGSVKGLIVIDEAYIEFSEHSSSVFYLNKYENVIILRTFSKAWGMAGVRCGVILGDKRVIHALRYVQLPFGFSTFSQEKVRECLQNSEETFLSWERIKRNREDLVEKLSELKGITKVFKSHTNFIMLVLKDLQRSLSLLEKHRILVLDCSASLPNSIRVSIGNEEQNTRFLEAMREGGNFGA